MCGEYRYESFRLVPILFYPTYCKFETFNISLRKISDMEDRYDISVDIGDGKDYSVATLFENGEYRPIAVCDSISFGDVEHSGYVGVEAGELTVSTKIVDVDNYALRGLLGLSKEMELLGVSFKKLLDSQIAYWDLMVSLCNQVKGSKRRKTTYKTIRRDCAKRNRHK